MKEQDVIDAIIKMGAPSLPPDEFEQLENIVKFLKRNRKALREGEERSPVERGVIFCADRKEVGKKNSIEEFEQEIEASHIRMSSNDDACYAVEMIDRLLDMIKIEASKSLPHPDGCYCIFCE